jgi:ATP-dependent DNA ligase
MFFIFDVLEHEGRDTTRLQYSERCSLLDTLRLDGSVLVDVTLVQ